MDNKKSSHWATTQNDVVTAAFEFDRQKDLSSTKYFQQLLTVRNFDSICDLGCGLGIWLNKAKELGIKDIRGYDIPEIDVNKRMIPKDSFIAADLSKPINIDRRFDIAMSIEVAEHLPINAADIFVKTLTELSDWVMFGAAIPYQGGMGHINENWIEFWSNSFRKHNYICYDLFRDKFWHDNSVIYYYRQNTMLYVKEGTDSALIKMGYKADLNPKTYIHPDMYIKALNRPLPPQEKQVYTDVNIYYDQAKNGGNKVQEEKKNIYGDKHLGWKHQINRFKKYS